MLRRQRTISVVDEESSPVLISSSRNTLRGPTHCSPSVTRFFWPPGHSALLEPSDQPACHQLGAKRAQAKLGLQSWDGRRASRR